MTDRVSHRRLFIASWPAETTRSAVLQATREPLIASGGRAVDAGGLHVTLAFLGGVDTGRVDALRDLLTTIRAQAFEYRFDTVESWPGPKVLALTQREAPGAAQLLVERLWALLEPLGFVPDTRPHRPHVTLARKVAGPAARQTIPPIHWPVRDIFLVESLTSSTGASYTPIAAHDFSR